MFSTNCMLITKPSRFNELHIQANYYLDSHVRFSKHLYRPIFLYVNLIYIFYVTKICYLYDIECYALLINK